MIYVYCSIQLYKRKNLMKDKLIPIRISSEELDEINVQFKEELIHHDIISRSEFIRRLLKLGIETHRKENAKHKKK